MCGLASDFPALVAFRVLQDVGGAMLGANSVGILVKATSASQRGRAMGLSAAAQAIGAGAGPVFGGLVLDSLGWRWIFWASVPMGILGAVAGALVVPLSGDLNRDKRFALFGAGLGLLIAPNNNATVSARLRRCRARRRPCSA